MNDSLRQPVFFIGMPRSGTTVIFEVFSRHPQLAWPSNYTERYPRRPATEYIRALLDNRRWSVIGRKGQYGKHRLGNRYFPHPAEAYPFWNHYACAEFGRSYLRDRSLDDETIDRVRHAVADIVRIQGRNRFAAKFTGPPRIRYLAQIFPDARFIHVVRGWQGSGPFFVASRLLEKKWWLRRAILGWRLS